MGEKKNDDIKWSEAFCDITGEVHIFETRVKHDLHDGCWCAPVVILNDKKRIVYRHNTKGDAN